MKVYDLDEAAELLGVGWDWLRRQAHDKKVSHVRLGRRIGFTEEQLREIVEANTVHPVVVDRRGSARTRL